MSERERAREVITVLGTIRPDEMGVTQTHEHLFLDAMDHYPGYGYQMVIDDEEVLAREIKELRNNKPRPARDFQYIIHDVEDHHEYGFRGLVWKKWVSAEDCLEEYSRWKASL